LIPFILFIRHDSKDLIALVPRRRLLWEPKRTMAKEIKTVTDDIPKTHRGLNRCALPILHHHIDIQIPGIDHGAGDKNEDRRRGRVDLVSSGIGDILMEDDPRGVLGVQDTGDQEQTQHDSGQETRSAHRPHLHNSCSSPARDSPYSAVSCWSRHESMSAAL